jgi:16S rRNA (guanine966-N2)-methyltransferase
VRIIAGELRGRRVRAPRGMATRPTSDRVREALFNVLAPRMKGACCLDAYAGTGAIGIEALSRGAMRCVFVESDAGVARILGENLRTFGIEDRTEVLVMPFARAASAMTIASGCFDIVFLDPPYGEGEIRRALRLCSPGSLLRRSGILVAEHDKRQAMPQTEGSLVLSRALRYGGTVLSYYVQG